MNDNKIIITNEKMEKKEYLILSKFNIKNKKDQYILFTDKSIDENKNIRIFSGILEEGKIIDIIDIKDKEIIDAYLKMLEQDIRNGMKFA